MRLGHVAYSSPATFDEAVSPANSQAKFSACFYVHLLNPHNSVLEILLQCSPTVECCLKLPDYCAIRHQVQSMET